MSGARDLVGRLHASEGSRLKGLFRARPRVPLDTADATQGTCPLLDAIANPQACLFALARSVAIGHRAARDRVLSAASPDPQSAARPGPDVERLISAWQMLALLPRAIRQLPRRYRQVLILGRLHRLPNGEIAAKSQSADITSAGRTHLTGPGVEWSNSFFGQPRAVSLALTQSF